MSTRYAPGSTTSPSTTTPSTSATGPRSTTAHAALPQQADEHPALNQRPPNRNGPPETAGSWPGHTGNAWYATGEPSCWDGRTVTVHAPYCRPVAAHRYVDASQSAESLVACG